MPIKLFAKFISWYPMVVFAGIAEQDEFAECFDSPQSDYADITSRSQRIVHLLKDTVQRLRH